MKTNICSGCGAVVLARRKSTTGDHWCKDPKCQSKRQVAWRRQKAERTGTDKGLTVTEARMAFVRSALDPECRADCAYCGLRAAVVGYVHRGVQPGSLCFELGRRGNLVGLAWIDLVHPERVPE